MWRDAVNPYAWILRIRRWLYRKGWLRSECVSVPVISVGNLSSGGVGKTPIVIAIASHCVARGLRVAVVSRGYRRASSGLVVVQDSDGLHADVLASGDEAQMVARAVPQAIVIVDVDRVRGAKQAIALGAQVVVLDDGYQHLRIQRNLNLCVVDASRRTGGVIPFGLQREGLSALQDADGAVFTSAEHQEIATVGSISKRLRSDAFCAEVTARAKIAEGSLADGQRVLAVSGIAAPERFHRSVRGFGVEVVPFVMRDHAVYDSAVAQRIYRAAAAQACSAIVTTEKDWVKIEPLVHEMSQALPWVVVTIAMEFLDGADAFYQRLDDVIRQ